MGHIQMSQKELSRIEIIHRVIKRGITQVRAGELLGISERQVRRLSKRVKNEGNEGLCHRSRGCPSIRHLSAKTDLPFLLRHKSSVIFFKYVVTNTINKLKFIKNV